MGEAVARPVGSQTLENLSTAILILAMNKKEKIYVTSLNFHESPLFLSKLQNWAKHLPQLLKPFILPPLSYYKQF
jgi:hypothetical protein